MNRVFHVFFIMICSLNIVFDEHFRISNVHEMDEKVYGGQTMSKRKVISIVLLAFVTTLMLACAVIFTACGSNETPDDGQNTEQSGGNPDDGNTPGTNPGGEDDTPGTNPGGDDNPGTDEPQDIAVTSVSLDRTSLTLEIGESYTLVATVSPSNATDKSITWSSTDSSVASVSGGKVTAKSEGATTITATAHNGKTAICTVTVNEPASEVVEVTSVSLNKTSLTLEIGESETLTATVLPSNATNKSVTWTSSVQSVATVANGKVTAVGSGTATITATTSNGKKATCSVTVDAAVPAITQVEGATIDGTEIFMLVDHTTDSVPLLNKVTVSSGRWDLYSDILGQNRIPTKIAAGSNGKLQNGENVFYIMLENENGDLAEVYTLTVYRSYAVSVNYYNHKNVLVHSETAYTGYEYALNFDYSTPGYTFNSWKENGVAYQSRVLWNKLSLYADMMANEYTIALDANGGMVGTAEQKVTYDTSYSLPLPEREGHTFLGWYVEETQLTDERGQSLVAWQLPENSTLTAAWKINQYDVAIEYESSAGTVTGTAAGTYDYDTEITLTASAPDLGYAFLGWYLNGEFVTTENTYNFSLPANNVSLVAQYKVLSEMSVFTFTSTLTSCTITGIKDKTVTSIAVPDYVTNIEEGAFSGCASLESITLPFVGGSATATSASSSTLFGYVFGTSRYTGGTATQQYYSVSSSTIYYIPTSLTSVMIGDSVTSIGSYVFYGCSGLTNITIPSSVTSIGNYAFYGCSGLTGVMLPDSVTGIGDRAFYNCSGLTNITIPSSVTSIGNYAFSDCSGLTSVHITDLSAWCRISFKNYTANPLCKANNLYLNGTLITNLVIPDSVTSIESYAFSGYSELTSVMIGDSVTSIESYAFSSCSELTSVMIGDSVTGIGDYAFYNCSGLTSLTIPDSVTSIGSYAFSNCSGLTSVTIGNGVTSIGSSAFYGCSGLTGVTIPDSVTSIGYLAFYNCTNLTSVTIGDGVTSIRDHAFSGCSGLTSITIPDSVTSIGVSAFSGCSGLTSVHITDLSAWCKISFGDFDANPLYYAHNLYLNSTLVTDLVIPDGVTTIGSCAFYNCSGLTSVMIGDSVTSIGSYAFMNCGGLKSVIIGDSVTSIGDQAFWGCSGLTTIYYNAKSIKDLTSSSNVFNRVGRDGAGIKIIFGDTVEKIPTYLFYVENSVYWSNIISATIGNSVTSIGSYAFYNCSGLTSVMIGDSVTSIGDRAFWGCSGLTSVTIGNSVTSIGSAAFRGCSGLTSVTIGNSVTSIGRSAFSSCSRLTNLTIPDSVTSIGSSAFECCSGLTSVTIGNSVTSIGSYAFYNCSKLTNVTIGNSVTSIEGNAFYGCSKLTNVRITDLSAWCKISFGDFDANPLYYAHNLYLNSTLVTDLVIPDGVTTIRSYAFYNCSGLTNLTIPDSVTSIGSYAFSNCSGLTSATIGNSVMSIGDYAFEGCSKLTSVTFENLNGWWLASISTSGSGWVKNRSLSSSSLSNPATAANYLKSTYCNYYWKRS